jgi:hypothetical protein
MRHAEVATQSAGDSGLSEEAAHGCGTKATKVTKTTKVFVIFVIMVSFVTHPSGV